LQGAAAAPAGAASQAAGGWRFLRSPVILLGFAYFVLSAFANQGVQSQAITTLMAAYGLALSAAALAVTVYLLGNAAGVVAGGLLAERTNRHHQVAMSGILVACGAMLGLYWSGGLSPLVLGLMALGGAAYGITQPSRDIIIRRAAAGSGLGSVFGFVYSGFDLASALAPLAIGAMIDQGWPREAFLVLAAALLIAVPTVRQVRPRLPAAPSA
jgi:MFS family permease